MLTAKSLNRRSARITQLDDTITLVVHVVGSEALQQAVTNQVIQSQVDVLNEDYQGLNADSVRIPAAFKPRFGKSRLTFKMAGTNIYGEPTNGIVRRVIDTSYNQGNFDNAKVASAGGSEAWDPEKYLNIWVVDFGSGAILGISVFPGDPRPLKFHGFTCDYRAFGRNAPHLFSAYNKGRTTTHELGHFFNLYHIWGDDDGGCSETDFPGDPSNDDTPNQADATESNPDPTGAGEIVTDNCTPASPGIMYQNFMDYTDDEALVMFTNGQQLRMEESLTTSPDRLPLLLSTAYQPAVNLTYDANLRLIVSPLLPLCSVSFSPVITLRNSGSLPLTSATIVSVLGNNTPVTFNWTGNLPPYTEINITLPSLTGVVGQNDLTVYTMAPNNANDQRKTNDTLSVRFEIFGITPLVNRIEENFSTAQFPPPLWRINNPDGDTTWAWNPTIGKDAPGSAWFNDWNNATFHRFDDLIAPNLSYSDVDSIFLFFNLAAATYAYPGTTELDIDTLTILVTKDCGNTFSTLYKKWGEDLQTVNDPNFPFSTEFFPNSNQWRRDSVNLGLVLGRSEAQFQVYFRISGNFENNVFIDDVVIETEVVPQRLKEEGYLILPSPFRTQFSVWHYQQPSDLRAVTVYNAAGQLVWRGQYNGDADKIIHVNLQGQAAGVYFVKLHYNGRESITRQILKQ